MLSSILDDECAAFMQRVMEKHGVRFVLGDSVSAFAENTATFNSGRTVDFDVLILAVGVRANVSLIKDAGGDVNRGIIVDGKSKTSLPDIYAAGDCTEVYDASIKSNRVLAILPSAYFQGFTAGLNMAGGDAEVYDDMPINAIGFYGIHSLTAGFTGTRLGYTVIPKSLVRGGMSFNSMWVRNRTTKTNGVSYIIQKGGAAVFTAEGQKEIKENIAYYKENAKILMRVLDKYGINYTGGVNAPYIWLKCPKNLGSWQFFDLLLEKIQVVGTPGEGFGSCGEGFFRFSTFGSREDTLEAAKRLQGFFETLLK